MVGSDAGMPPDVRRVVDGMSDRGWRRLILELGRYALQKSRRFYWRTGSSGELPYGEVTESIVSKACLLWLSGRRQWNRAEYADLESFLKAAIDSLLSHSASGFDNRGISSGDDRTPDARVTPESELIDREQAAESDRMLLDLVHQSAHDDVALAIIDAIRQGAASRRAIIDATGRPADVIDNGLKRLRRAGAAIARARASRASSV
jgi:hypothetical protein